MKVNFRILLFVSILLLLVLMVGSLMMMAASQSTRQQRETPGLSNFDIRTDESKDSRVKLAAHRQKLTARQRARQSDARQYIREAKTEFETRGASGEVMLSRLTGGPEVVSAGLQSGRFLTNASSQNREQIVRSFLRGNSALYGLRADQVTQLTVSADYVNPAGNLAWITLDQKFNNIPVFAGQLRAALTPAGQLVRTVSTLAAGIDEGQLQATPAVSAEQAVAIAAAAVGVSLEPGGLSRKSASSDGRKVVFAGGPFVQDIQVELVYFPLETGLVNLGWSMVLWQDVPAYYSVVDAEKGDLFFRKNITNEQTQSVTYSIYNDDSPAPLSPANILPGSGTQALGINRTLLTLISELPAFNNLGWIPDGGNVTTGNNVDAGLDLSSPNGIDASGRATGSPNRVFDFSYNPPPLGTDAPSGTNFRMGIVTDLFFWSNRYHDQVYQYGFTEAAGNFQGNNFGRGGTGNDFVRAEAQDSSGTDNANFSTPPDGQLPRMQMYLFTGPAPQRDGSIDHDIVLHELTHGLSNRLHGNASGLNSTQSVGMGEGWSDFYARALLASADEDVNGIYAAAGYATLSIEPGFVDNYYYGIRRFPYAVITNVGLNGKPHNPLTFADIDPTKINLTDGAFPAAFTGRAEEVHNIGEVWCMALLEVRARIIARLGFVAGNARTLQIVTDGMKLDPVNPTLLDARNAIVMADRAGFGGADEADIWAGFAARGMGFSAKVNGGVNVTESFDLPNLALGSVTFSDAGCNNNGFAEPGEMLTLTVPVSNPSFNTSATSVTAAVTGGGMANYGTINAGASATQTISYMVPADTPCGSLLTLTFSINSNFGAVTRTFQILIGQPVTTFTENFDSVTAPALPAGWTTVTAGGGTAWVTSTTTPDTAPNGAFTPNGTTAGGSTLVSPVIPITVSGARLTFRHRYDFEEGFDGGGLDIKIGSGAFTDILTAGGSFLTNPYNEILPPSFTDCLHGVPRHNAWTGNSGGYVTVVVQLPAAAAGQNIQLRWIAGFDCGVAATGWRVDTISITGAATCASAPCGGGSGLQFYPLAAPVRLLDTRAGATGCVTNVGTLAAGSTRTEPARTACSTVPAGATAIIGNITVVPSGPGFLTLYPSDATQPTVANSNFTAGEVTNNFFTVGLGTTGPDAGAFKIFTSAATHVIIDITGYYAPPGAGGLYYHPLPSPVRLVQTFPGQTGCFQNASQQLVGQNNPNANPALDLVVDGRGAGLPSPCNGIPGDAAVLVGNATTVFPQAPFGFGYLTIYPSDATRPTVASSNYGNNDIINGPFAVKLGADGKFKVYTFSTTHLVIDISGYYSASANDANGAGLLFNPLPKPMRLLETRADFPGFPLTGCYRPNAPIAGGTGGIRTQQVWGTCSDQPITIPNAARAVVGNVTVINPVGAGFGTFFPGNVGTAPTVATTNYPFPVVFGYNRHYYVGLSPTDGTFKILTQFTSDYIVDVSGYFAP